MSPTFEIHREQVLEAPIDQVFPFFASPENLERLTPRFLGFSILTPRPIAMRVGQRIDYRIRLRGLPMRWTSEITVYEPPFRFVDVQLKGPYQMWEHEHRFIAEGEWTRVIDHVRYQVLGGALVNRLLVAPDLARIFEFRAKTLSSIFAPDSNAPELAEPALQFPPDRF